MNFSGTEKLYFKLSCKWNFLLLRTKRYQGQIIIPDKDKF